ncbi:hypothetical protein D9758_015062 [Tetrapyrgos nigripes]|uniref:Uncharacterized protein n=1 Tax=Tetrapyrgos nigripes TaxID=182062 RepID=A0A8H5CUA5_9AGAR|nr:hypothetical protein D9758_015062 [Tetrapyrgos nigripes]
MGLEGKVSVEVELYPQETETRSERKTVFKTQIPLQIHPFSTRSVAVSPIQAVSSSSSSFKKFRLLAAGTSGGIITIYAIAFFLIFLSFTSFEFKCRHSANNELLELSKALSSPLVKFRRSDAGAEDLAFTSLLSLPSLSDGGQGLGFVAARTDGLPWIQWIAKLDPSLRVSHAAFGSTGSIEESQAGPNVGVGVSATYLGTEDSRKKSKSRWGYMWN